MYGRKGAWVRLALLGGIPGSLFGEINAILAETRLFFLR